MGYKITFIVKDEAGAASTAAEIASVSRISAEDRARRFANKNSLDLRKVVRTGDAEDEAVWTFDPMYVKPVAVKPARVSKKDQAAADTLEATEEVRFSA